MIPLLNRRGEVMKGFVQGADRQQTTLLPECLDDWVEENNPVRAVDVFVDALDLRDLGFDGVVPAATGRPAYHPSPMLKLYIYGYLNRVQSSRRLEREAGRNLEVMWLTGRLVPDHKTIADFRKDNGCAIKKVCAQFVALCRQMGLLAKASVAIDGSKFKAVNSRDNNFTKGKMDRRLAQIEESVARYLSQLDTADRQTAAGEAPSEELAARTTRLKEKLAKLEEEVKRLKAIEKQMLAAPGQQISFTDPDSRSMATSGRGSGMVGYNVQAAVDTANHLIVAHEVSNVGTDKSQLANMANQAKAALEAESLEAFADRGYFKGEEILACEEAGITVTLPKPQTSGAKSEGRFGKQDFRYVAEEDVYICPAGERLAYHYTNEENGLVLRRYWTNACHTCALKAQCTKGPQRRITRWEHEHVVEAVQTRLDKNPDAMRTRRETVEHPFGTLKMRMGADWRRSMRRERAHGPVLILSHRKIRTDTVLLHRVGDDVLGEASRRAGCLKDDKAPTEFRRGPADSAEVDRLFRTLFEMAHAATQIGNPGNIAHLFEQRGVCAGSWKHVADLGDFTL